MITNPEHPKNVAAVYIIADELYYRCDFTYGVNKSGNITFKVVMESPDNHKTENLFIWNELKQKWRCKYPRKLTKEQVKALIKKIIEIDRNN